MSRRRVEGPVEALTDAAGAGVRHVAREGASAVRVLLVESVPETGGILRAVFESRGMKVTIATSADEALGRARWRRPDVVVVDLTAPGVDGERLARDLAADPLSSHLPVIGLLGRRTTPHDSSTFTAMVSSPVDPAALIDEVRRALERVH